MSRMESDIVRSVSYSLLCDHVEDGIRYRSICIVLNNAYNGTTMVLVQTQAGGGCVSVLRARPIGHWHLAGGRRLRDCVGGQLATGAWQAGGGCVSGLRARGIGHCLLLNYIFNFRNYIIIVYN